MGRNHAIRVALLAGFLSAAGCRPNPQRFIPAEQAAQNTLESALKAWQAGLVPPCRVQDAAPAVEIIDTQHRPGQTLNEFTVLGPTPCDAPRCFAVRLTFDNPRQEVRARFVVLGLDPLWVMRYEDYEMVSHWDHPMPEKVTPPKKAQR